MTKAQEVYLELVKKKPVAFANESGFLDMGEIHNTWIKTFLLGKSDYTLQAHRGSYKTTALSVAIALMLIVQPHRNVIFLRKTENDVKEIVAQIAKLLTREIFQDLSLALYGKPVILTKSTAFELDTNLNVMSRGTAQLVAIGTGGSLTGKHGDIIITDDIINLTDRLSKSERDRTKMIYQELQNIKNRGGRIINTGTPWHRDDAFSLMDTPDRYDCYSTGLMTEADIKSLKSKLTSSLFAANYELKHIADEDTLFPDPQMDDGSRTQLIYNGLCHIDAGYSAGSGDFTAFTIAKEAEDGNIYVYGLLRHSHVDDCLEEFERRRSQLRAGTLYNETNGDKGYLLRKIQEPKRGYHEKTNKFIKITSHIKPVWERIVFVQGTDMDYISQIVDYSEKSGHDDAPDSLASVLRVLLKPQRADRRSQSQAIKYLGL